MKTEKGKLTSIYELRTLPSMCKVQRFSLTTEDGRNVFFNCFNNVELLNNRKVGDYVAVEYNERKNGQFLNNYANNILSYDPDALKPEQNMRAIASSGHAYDKELEFLTKYGIDIRNYKQLNGNNLMKNYPTEELYLKWALSYGGGSYSSEKEKEFITKCKEYYSSAKNNPDGIADVPSIYF